MLKRILTALLALALLLLGGCAKTPSVCYDALGAFGEADMWPVAQNGKWGFVDGSGRLIVPCEWDGAADVRMGHASVCRDGKWGAIDRTGRVIVPCGWARLAPEVDGGFTVTDFNGLDGALAADGTVLIPCDRYTYVGPVINGARKICQDDLWGLCTETGEVITPCQWYETGYFNEELAWVTGEAYAHGYINRQGEVVIPCQYSYAEDFIDGSAVVRFPNGNYQLINTEGSYLCENAWAEMETFSRNGLLRVRRDGKFGYINRRGEVVIPPRYDYGQEFSDGWALVQLNGEVFWIDETGARMLDRPEGTGAQPYQGGLTILRDAQGLYGLMDKQGRIVLPCGYEQIRRASVAADSLAILRSEGMTGFASAEGALIGGGMRPDDAFGYGYDGDRLFLLEDGVLSIYAADGKKLH